jgi:hypothetical protein
MEAYLDDVDGVALNMVVVVVVVVVAVVDDDDSLDKEDHQAEVYVHLNKKLDRNSKLIHQFFYYQVDYAT